MFTSSLPMTPGASEVPKSRALNCCSMIPRFSSMTRGMFLSMIAKRTINAAELQSRIDYRARPMTGSTSALRTARWPGSCVASFTTVNLSLERDCRLRRIL